MRKAKRAKKMKKSKKFVLISGVLVATLGMGTMAYNLNEGTLSNLIESKLVAYNYNKENALDNVFTQDGMTILPFIYKDSEQTISEEDIRNMFDKTGIRIQSISTDVIGTGTKIETEGKTYTILIYGDVDGDGYVDVFDAQKIIQHYVYEGDYELKGIYALAANVDNEDDEIDVFDAQRIVQFYVGYEQKLVVNEPISDKEKDKEKPIITLIGENPQKIKLGDKYIELGATVTDNMDNNVKVKIDSSKVKTDKVGTYIVTYNAKDASGNKADKVKRTVIVEDYIKDIEVIKPTKTEYQYGENIDLNGAKVRIKYASGDTKTIDMKEDMITGYNKNKVGIQEITVTYEGNTAKFSVNVLPQQQDYITGIEIKSPTKTNYKVGQTLDLTGAKFKTVMNSGAETSEQEITKEMIDVKTLDKVGTTTVTVSYETNNTIDDTTRVFTKTFTVQVVNYVSDIEITLLPNKLEYKYGQTIDTEGMVINAVMGDKTKKDITSQVSLDSKQLNEIGTTEVTVSYETDDTIDDTTKTFVKKFNIEVKNYVKDIELEKIPTITDYVEDQEIKKDGMILNSIKANGEKEKIDLEDKNIEITPIKAKYGSNTITITYKTDNTIDDTTKTFTKTFEISVVKKLKNIVVTKKQTTTNRYEEILIADVSSGLNEERISAEKLAVEIKDSKNNIVDDENIAKVTKTDSQFGGQVDLSFVATKAGKYTITPKVGTIVGDAIEVTVTENQIVNQIAVGDIGEKFRINQTRTVNVDFAHKYAEGEEINLDITADRLTIEAEGLECTLRDSDDNAIDVSKKPKAIVKKISIKATETGNKELKIIVDKDDENAKYIKTESITILPEAEKELKIDNESSSDITLYFQESSENTMIQKGKGDYIYTLLPVWIEDEDGVRTKVKLKDLTDGTVKVTNSFDDPNDPLQSIKTSGYKTNGNSVIEVTNTNDEIDYIAVGLLDEQAAEDLKGETMTISYKNNNINLTIKIQEKEIANIVVTKKQTTTNRYEETIIASISSGLNEERISAEKLAVEIKDSKNNIVDDENIAKVTKTDSQFGGQVDLSFVATKAGKYTITPKIGTIVGDAIEVTVTENQIVNQITVGDIGEKFRINQTRTVNVDFAHKYAEGEEINLDITADRLTIEAEGLECTLRDSDDNAIDVSKKPKAIVKKISIKATETGNKELKIIVDKDDENAKYIKTESINILPEAEKELKIDNENSSDITLYFQESSENTMIQKGKGDYIYTLLPVWIEDEDGVRTRVRLKDLTDGTVKVTNSFDDPNDPLQSIKTSGYKTNGNSVIEVTNTNDEIDYIAVGLLDEQAAEDLKGETMTISYKNTNINLTIKIQEKEIANIVVTKKQTTTNRYEETIIASISSGLNEKEIDKQDLQAEIKDSKNNIVDDENIAKVTKTDSQFGGQVDLSFVATKAGKYTITPKIGTIVGDAIEVTVTENQIVNQITVGDIGEKFRINQTRTVNVDFVHKYTEHGTTADINMEADRLTIETEGLEYTLRDSDDNVIDVSKKPKAIVKKISIKATETGNKELKIIVDKDDENAKYIKTESITILPEAEKELKIDNKNSNDIILYLQKPEGNTMVQKGNGDYIYTLLPVWIEDEDGVRTKVKLKDLIDGTVKVTNSFDDPNDPLQSIKTSGYKTNGNSVIEVTNTNDEIDYIAVGLLDEQAGEDLNNKVIKISYGQITKTISLNILVQN